MNKNESTPTAMKTFTNENEESMRPVQQLAADSGLTLVVRGTRYARLQLGDKKLTVFRDAGWEPATRAWLAGWGQSQNERKLWRLDGCVEVDGREIQYFWVVPATIISAFRVDADQVVAEHVRDEFKRGATRGLMHSYEEDGAHTTDVHGWWWSGNEEAVLREKEAAAREAKEAAYRKYDDELELLCKTINDVYDVASAARKKCFLIREGVSLGRINSRSVRRYVWIAVHLSAEGRTRTIRLAPKFVDGFGAGKYVISTSDGSKMLASGSPPAACHTEITIPGYPGIAGDRSPFGRKGPMP